MKVSETEIFVARLQPNRPFQFSRRRLRFNHLAACFPSPPRQERRGDVLARTAAFGRARRAGTLLGGVFNSIPTDAPVGTNDGRHQ